ncbi:MAG: nucleoside hydrolase [Spirochaetia bacterium]|jgi:ribosylpyrimidine nucleosidase|nr:nucleoside hydrolase [Spirochaetia bacterium]
MKERILIDCDTGQDDAVAILLAAGSDKLQIEGIIAVAGNVSLAHTLENNLHLVEAMGKDIPVFRGAEKPLVREPIKAGHVHGTNGLAGYTFPPDCSRRCSGNGIAFIIKTIMENPGQISLVATGPLTDIALAFREEPRLAENVKQVVLMGGSMGEGNITPSAEFNIYADPEAAQIVFSSHARIYMMGLDVTLQVTLTDQILERFRKEQEADPRTMRGLFLKGMESYTRACMDVIHDFPSMHDPCCIAYLLDSSLFTFTRRNVVVETKGTYTYGRTVALWPEETADTFIGIKVDALRFWDLLSASLSNLR